MSIVEFIALMSTLVRREMLITNICKFVTENSTLFITAKFVDEKSGVEAFLTFEVWTL
jgi:hypothetical protein